MKHHQTRKGFLRSRFLRDLFQVMVLLGAICLSITFTTLWVVGFDWLVKHLLVP